MIWLPRSLGRELVWNVVPGRLELVKARLGSLVLSSVSCDLELQASGAKATVNRAWVVLSTGGCGSNQGREGHTTSDLSLSKLHDLPS